MIVFFSHLTIISVQRDLLPILQFLHAMIINKTYIVTHSFVFSSVLDVFIHRSKKNAKGNLKRYRWEASFWGQCPLKG